MAWPTRGDLVCGVDGDAGVRDALPVHERPATSDRDSDSDRDRDSDRDSESECD